MDQKILKSFQPKQEIELLTCGSVMKDFWQLNTDLRRGKTCFSDKDRLNKIIRINKIIKMIEIIKMIKMIKIIEIIKIIKIIRIIKIIEIIKIIKIIEIIKVIKINR